MRDNAEIPLDEVARSGLGLTGAGAYGTARALLVCLLAAGGSGRRAPSVVIPEADINRLLSESLATGIVGNAAEPPNLMITDSLAEALSYLETEITDRSQPPEGSATGATPELAATVADERQEPGIALIAHPGQPAAGRLQALLETSERTGFIAILLGHWDSGITCNIGADGVVTAASRPGLPGIQTFHLPEHDAVPVLKFLRGAHGDVADDRPGNPFPLPYPAPRPQPAGPAASVHGDHVSRGKDTEPGPGGPPDRPSKPVGPLAAPDQVPGQPHPQAEARLSAPVVTATAPLVEVRLLGVPRIEAGDQEVVKGLRRTSRELIAFLSLFSDGVTGEKVAAALWPDHEPSSARTALQDALRSLRVALRTATGAHGLMFVTFQASRYRIDSTTVDVDLWRFRAAVVDAEQALRNDDAIAAREALTRAVECYQGPLAEDAAYEWIAPYREEIRRQAVDASTRLAWMYEPPESEQALALLDRTLAHDPFNEQLYQRIMTVQAHLGRADAVQRTLRLLEARLNELDTSPTRETYDLARDLQRPPQRA